MKAEVLDSYVDSGKETNVSFKSGQAIPGAIKRSDKFKGLYVLRFMLGDGQGGVKGAAEVTFSPEDVEFIVAPLEETVVKPEGAGKIIVPK